ncbi:hypothetical protein FEK33_19800 [Nocardia asteroides NBRC 15531]|uniref:Uncharacterized protein n=1 Tax=Nocardia asteroides NBRC 15531 TaxID=1110697 RepID=U5EMC2_NOCAS|nr:hypothetical protein [Nocardia asteroides]TLF65550.1 hypothetical protein FEK33_19800 [Nocardia asteroides NBRC 15531]UGT47689.1 hypothetical protein LT345_24825 [Nocardia asteroides]SFM52576.1 hypothetical protein SAMN05444423_103266 [Nocardia asteroides]VEG33392.1 Uncharacterised protein [Nocardia asteroides]GAD87541.1 hypothetical protein NCAST_35_00630 [Nocardia asteroides NBRC 15531]
MSGKASGGLVVNKQAMDATSSTLDDTVTTTRNAAKQVDTLEWVAADAGRAYTGSGQKIDDALARAVGWVKVWTTASGALADAIGTASIEYTEVDLAHASDLNGVAPAPAK